MKKVLLSGCYGRMGRVVCQLIDEHPSFEIVCGFDNKVTSLKLPYPVYGDIDGLHSAFGKTYEKPDVIIDFSLPEGTSEILSFAQTFSIPVVIATTGLDEYTDVISEITKSIPIFQSANMSFEVALLRRALELLSPNLADSDIEVDEIHHNQKADAPSGTALLLANTINSSLDNSRTIVYGRTGKRAPNEIGISSRRGGNITGTHIVSYFGAFETLEITHTVHSRNVFAEGAIKAANFLIKQPPGLYNMDHMI